MRPEPSDGPGLPLKATGFAKGQEKERTPFHREPWASAAHSGAAVQQAIGADAGGAVELVLPVRRTRGLHSDSAAQLNRAFCGPTWKNAGRLEAISWQSEDGGGS